MKLVPGPETRSAVLKHPFVLAGVAVVALLGITAGVLVVIDSARGETDRTPGVSIEPKESVTPGARSRTAIAIGVTGRTLGVTAVRFAPGQRTAVLGTLGPETDVRIDGRTSDTLWLRVIFPPNSGLHGWVDADLLEVTGDPESLVVATAEPPIVVDVPTSPPRITETPEEGTPTPEGSATPDGLPDLVVGTTTTLSEGKLFVTVVNQGTGDMTGDLVIAVFNFDGSALVAGATLPGFTLEAGRSIDIGTGYQVDVSQTVLLVVDPNGDIEEADNTNNQITIAINVGDATPEPPLPFETPIPQ